MEPSSDADDGRWRELRGASSPPVEVASLEAFLATPNSRFAFMPRRDYDLAPPATVDDDLAFFHERTMLPLKTGRVTDGAKSVTRLSNRAVVHALRAFGTVFDSDGLYKSGGYMKHWKTLPDYMRRGGDRVLLDVGGYDTLPSDAARILVFYDGNIHNYKHWWIDMLAHLDAMANALGVTGDVVWPRFDEAPAAFQVNSLAMLGLPAARPPIAGPAVRYAEVVFTSQLQQPTIPFAGLDGFRRRVLARFGGLGAHATSIYVKRRGGNRSVANDGAMDAMMQGLGFVSAVMEDLSQAEQIRLFRDAAFVVGAHGAAFANMLFCPPGTPLLELMPDREYRPHYWAMAAGLGHRYGFLTCQTANGRFDAVLNVDLDRLRRLIVAMRASASP